MCGKQYNFKVNKCQRCGSVNLKNYIGEYEVGDLWGWGANGNGRLGDGTNENRYKPVRIMEDVIAISAGGFHSFAIKKDLSLWGWGDNWEGQLGIDTNDRTEQNKNSIKYFELKSYEELVNLMKMAEKDLSSFIKGRVNDKCINKPIKIMENVIEVSAGSFHYLAIKNDGSLWAWGCNEQFQLGDGTNITKYIPVEIMKDIIAISAGEYHSLAIKRDGSLWAWGSNKYGQLGNGTNKDSNRPIKILENVISISAGLEHCLAIVRK